MNHPNSDEIDEAENNANEHIDAIEKAEDTGDAIQEDNTGRIREGTQSTFVIGSLQIALSVGVLLLAVIFNRILLKLEDKPLISIQNSNNTIVQTVIPRNEQRKITVAESGVVQARNTITLTPQISGRIVQKSDNLVAGGRFEAGERLFRIDQANTQALVNQATANVRSAKSEYNLQKAEADFAVTEWSEFNPGKAVPPMAARKPQLEKALAAIESAEANLAIAKINHSRTDYSLGSSAFVLDSRIDVGVTVNAGQSYGTAYEPSSIEVSVGLSALDIKRLSPIIGRSVTIGGFDDPKVEPISGTVVRVDSQRNEVTRLNRIFIKPDEAANLSPGSFVDVNIQGPVIDEVYILPGSSLSGERVIWVVENETLRVRYPEIIENQDGQIVTLPFDIGDGVVTTVLSGAQDGQAIDLLGDEQ